MMRQTTSNIGSVVDVANAFRQSQPSANQREIERLEAALPAVVNRRRLLREIQEDTTDENNLIRNIRRRLNELWEEELSAAAGAPRR